jgi:hypothetical protein
MSMNLKEPTAKDFVVRNTNTISLSKVQGTHWNVVKCNERMRVIGQATINLDLGVWKSLEDS